MFKPSARVAGVYMISENTNWECREEGPSGSPGGVNVPIEALIAVPKFRNCATVAAVVFWLAAVSPT